MSDKIAVIFSQRYLEHETGQHVECPERADAIKRALIASDFADQLEWIEPEPAGVDAVAMIHDRGYIDFVRKSCERTSGLTYLNPDTAVSSESYDVALLAVGGVTGAVDMVLNGDAAHFFAVVRPPGHHAEFSESLGFCLFNNIAIGARHAIENRGIDRVFILDWDVHHGNGTQHSLDKDASVFFCSFHQSPHYPGTGRAGECGRGDGRGYTLNFPMPSGSDNNDYIYLMKELVVPAAERFKPQLVLVSAGFDAHASDPLSGTQLTEDGYAAMARLMMDATGGDVPIGLVLEGGYNLGTLSSSAAAATGALAGEPVDTDFGKPGHAALALAKQHLGEHPYFTESA